jgi:hypothetical protein
MYAKAPYTVLQWATHIDPAVSKFIPTMPEDLPPLQGLRSQSNNREGR